MGLCVLALAACAPLQQWAARNDIPTPGADAALYAQAVDAWDQPEGKDALSRLQRQYPDSPWAQRAQRQVQLQQEQAQLRHSRDKLQRQLTHEQARSKSLQQALDECNAFIRSLKSLIIQNEMGR